MPIHEDRSTTLPRKNCPGRIQSDRLEFRHSIQAEKVPNQFVREAPKTYPKTCTKLAIVYQRGFSGLVFA